MSMGSTEVEKHLPELPVALPRPSLPGPLALPRLSAEVLMDA